MAVVGSQGLDGSLPPYCGRLALLFFFLTMALNVARDMAPPSYRRYMPVPMAIGECNDTPTRISASLFKCFITRNVEHCINTVAYCTGIPFYLGAYLAVDMCIGSMINLVWAWVDPQGQEQLSMAAAAGLLVGDGVWTIPSSLLAMADVRAPVCMAFAGEAWTAT